MLEALSTPHNRRISFVLLLICVSLGIAAGVVGIADHAPGILLAFLAAAALFLVFVHPWRTPRQFRRLVLASVLVLVPCIVLENVLEVLASGWADTGPLHVLLQGLAVAAFMVAVLGFPPVFFMAIVGWIATSIRQRRQPRGPQTGA